MLMPGGELNARDGRRWRLDDAQAVVAETRRVAGAADLVFDYNHQTDHSKKNGQSAPAAGWIKALEVRAGAIWGRVDWTIARRPRSPRRSSGTSAPSSPTPAPASALSPAPAF